MTITRRLLTGADFTWAGSFRLPKVNMGPSSWASFDYAGDRVHVGLVFNPSSNSLFISGTTAANFYPHVTELNIPQLLTLPNVNALNTATFRQPFNSVCSTLWQQIKANGGVSARPQIGGLGLWNGKLLVGGYGYYDASNENVGIGTCSTTLADHSIDGCYGVRAPYTSTQNVPERAIGGWQSPIPANWQAKFGKPWYAGLGGVSVIGTSSYGASMVGYDPAWLGQSTAGKCEIFFRQGQPMLGYNWGIYPGSVVGSCFIDTGDLYGIVFPGFKPLGICWYDNDTPGWTPPATDPCNTSKGGHSQGVSTTLNIFDPDAVLAATSPWSVQPHEYTLGATTPGTPGSHPYLGRICAYISGSAWDDVKKVLYLFQPLGDGTNPLIHAFQLKPPSP